MAKYQEWISEEGLEKIKSMTQKGYSYERIAQKIGVSKNTIVNWAKKYPEFREALEEGMEDAVAQVEKSLFEKAISGNVTAMIFFLKNRDPEHWRDRYERNTKKDNEEQQARIEKLHAETKKLKGETDETHTPDDGFLDAINSSAKDDWDE